MGKARPVVLDLMAPMLARVYDPKIKYRNEEIIVQPKLDGFRCMAYCSPKMAERLGQPSPIILYSRQQKIIDVPLTHIRKELERIMSPTRFLDGELYIHGVPFNNLQSLITMDQMGSEELEFHVFDYMSKTFPGTSASYRTRFEALNQIVWQAGNFEKIKVIQSQTVRLNSSYGIDSQPLVVNAYEKYLENGYEGVILKNPAMLYENGKRSTHMFKLKPWFDNEFKIVHIERGEGKFYNLPVFTCETENGTQFRCILKGDQEENRIYIDFWKRYIGKMMRVKHLTIPGRDAPRQPIGLAVLEDKF